MGRRDRPVGHLRRRLRRQSIPTHGPRRDVGLHHQGRRVKILRSRPFSRAGRPQTESTTGYAPGQIETLWVLDIDGTVVVISTELWPGPSATAHADFADAVLDSIRIDRP